MPGELTLTLTAFRELFPAFASTADSAVNAALALAARVDGTALGYRVAAHILVASPASSQDRDGGKYPMEKMAIGEREQEYQLPDEPGHLEVWLMTSEYGRQYLALREAVRM